MWPPPGLEGSFHQLPAADGVDRVEQATAQAQVVRWKGDLRRRREVVDVARPADSVSDGYTGNEPGSGEASQVLQDNGPADSQGCGQEVGSHRAVASQRVQNGTSRSNAGRRAVRCSMVPVHEVSEGTTGPRRS